MPLIVTTSPPLTVLEVLGVMEITVNVTAPPSSPLPPQERQAKASRRGKDLRIMETLDRSAPRAREGRTTDDCSAIGRRCRGTVAG